MVSLNHNEGVDVIRHHHISVDAYVFVVVRNGFHFGFSNYSRVGKHYLSISTARPREHFLSRCGG